MKTLTIVTKDTTEVMSLAEAKEWLRVIGDHEDVSIQAMVRAAIAYAENYLNRSVAKATYQMTFDCFESMMYLWRPPVASVTAIEYIDDQGDPQSFDVAKTSLNQIEGILSLNFGEEWPAIAKGSQVKISYSSNGLASSREADDIMDAVRMTLTYHYDFRDDPNRRWKKASDNILHPYRIIPYS